MNILRGIFIAVTLCLLSAAGYSQDFYYITGNTNWSDLAPVPTSDDYVYIYNDKTLTIDVTDATCYYLQLGESSGGSKGTGTVAFSAASSVLDVTWWLYIGEGAYGGSIDMTNGGTLKIVDWFVARAGTWTPGVGTVEMYGTDDDYIEQGEYDNFYNLTVNKSLTYWVMVDGDVVTDFVVSNNLIVNGEDLVNYDGGLGDYCNFDFNNVTVDGASDEIWFGGAYTMSVSGNLTNNGTIDFGGASNTFLKMDGSAAQTISGANSITAEKFQIYNTGAGVTISKTINVDTDMTLNDGVVYTSAGSLINIMDGATSDGGSVASHVDGPMKKTGNEAFVFPLGDSNKWARLGISAPSTATTEYTAQYMKYDPTTDGYNNATMDASVKVVSSLEYWTLSQAINNDDVKITAYWEDAGVSGIGDCANITLAHWSGGLWTEEYVNPATDVTGTCSGTNSGTIQTNAVVTTYSPFTFASRKATGNALPIELTTFTATAQSDQVLVEWQTAVEIENDFFTVERSTDGVEFQAIARVNGAGNSSSTIDYKAIDFQPVSGLAYYRLKQTDFNGATSYSKTVAVNSAITEMGDVNIFPNPSTKGGMISVELTNFSSHANVTLHVTDMLGRSIYTRTNTLNGGQLSLQLDAANFAKGMYNVTISSNNKRVKRRLVVD